MCVRARDSKSNRKRVTERDTESKHRQTERQRERKRVYMHVDLPSYSMAVSIPTGVKSSLAQVIMSMLWYHYSIRTFSEESFKLDSVCLCVPVYSVCVCVNLHVCMRR